MVPRDEVGLWSILKHCIGKELSKITIPVVFNEPLSFLQRMAEIFEYTNYLNIADQCDDVIERMEVSGRLESAIVPSAPLFPVANELPLSAGSTRHGKVLLNVN